MQFSLIAVGKLREPYYRAAVNDYVDRIRRILPLHELEVVSGTGDEGNGHGHGALQKEAEAIGRLVHKPGLLVALNIRGTAMSTEQLSAWLQAQMNGSVERIHFVIGGAWGLAPALIERADLQLSLSSMTFPHEMARLILVEQLYRALMIWKNHPYHK